MQHTPVRAMIAVLLILSLPARAVAAMLVATLIATPVVAQIPERAACAASPTPVATQPATIPIDVYNNHVYIKVCVGDQPLEFVLDTGASMNFFDLHTAERLGIKTGEGFTGTGAGAGSVAGARLEGASVRIAGTSLTQSVSGALDFSRLPPRSGHRMDGMLGYEFIRRFVVAIDYVKQELRLYDARTFRYEGPATSIPLIFIENQPHVMAEVRLADGASIKGRMVLDVGSGGALALTKPFADENHLRDRIGPTIHRQTGAGIGGPITSDVGRVEALKVGAVEVARPVTSLAGASAGNFSGNDAWIGNIGGDILRRFTVFLDYANKRMILEPHAGTREPFEGDMSGFALLMNDSLSRAWVDYVVPGSAASDAGLAVGDTLVSIDGKPATGAAIREVRKRFRRDGERIVLTVRRAGMTRTVTLVLRRLV
jgi:hypothetical protein